MDGLLSSNPNYAVPRLGFIAWNSSIAPDANTTFVQYVKGGAVAHSLSGKMFELSSAATGWVQKNASKDDFDETVKKEESNSLSNKNYYTLQVGLNADSFRNAGLNILTRSANADWARPGIGFEREGIEGAYLYYENGKFYFCDHHGSHHQITST